MDSIAVTITDLVRTIRALVRDTSSWLALAAALLAQSWAVGCVTSRSAPASRIQEADSKMVSGCTYLGEVYGASSLGGPDIDIGIENAKTEALEQAAAKRATHVVWNALVGGKEPNVSGKAYRCPLPVPTPRTP